MAISMTGGQCPAVTDPSSKTREAYLTSNNSDKLKKWTILIQGSTQQEEKFIAPEEAHEKILEVLDGHQLSANIVV